VHLNWIDGRDEVAEKRVGEDFDVWGQRTIGRHNRWHVDWHRRNRPFGKWAGWTGKAGRA
jgi:hypothetical protein